MSVYIKNVCKSFDGRPVLRNMNVTLEDGGIYCLMGPSGMGKTTILRIMMGMETKDSGSIEGISENEISAMFQENRLMEPLSAVENIMMVYTKKPRTRDILTDLARILPKECLKQPASELSGGMKRRVALARAMHYNGKMIILDEPFTGLDHDTKEEVISYILENRRGRILLIATHGLDDAALLGAQIIRLDECQDMEYSSEAFQTTEQEGESSQAGHAEQKPDNGELRILSGISPEKKEQVMKLLDGHVREFKNKSVVWRQEEQSHEIACVLEGKVDAYMTGREQTEQLIARFEAGNCFGEMLPLTGAGSPVEVRAAMDSKILYFSVEKLQEMPDTMEEVLLQKQVLWNLLREMASKTRKISVRMETIAESTVRIRIRKYLENVPENEDGIREIFDKKKDLAQYLGVTQSALSRELTAMKKDGLIDIDGARVKLLK